MAFIMSGVYPCFGSGEYSLILPVKCGGSCYWTSVGWTKSLGLVTSFLPKGWGILRKHKKSSSENMLRSRAFCLPFRVLARVQRRKIFSLVVIYAVMTVLPQPGQGCHSCFSSFFPPSLPSDVTMLNSYKMHKVVIKMWVSHYWTLLFSSLDS